MKKSQVINHKLKVSRGFTLVETFVAISILIVSILGPMTLFSRSIADGNFAANKITAFYLAQEGLELTINKKQSNFRSGENWLFQMDPCITTSGCEIELGSIDGIDSNEGLLYLDGDGIYTHSSGGNTPTIFHRTVLIELTTVSGEVKVSSIIKWENKNSPQTLILDTYIYDGE